MAYDSGRGRVVMFGGSVRLGNYGQAADDTWEYAPINPAAHTPFGTGCPGSGGTPTLGSEQGFPPWIAATFFARLTNLGTNTATNLPFLLLGDSKALSGSVPLPLDLTFAGMPGCALYTNALVTFGLTNVGGTATWSVPIPNNPSYVGVSLYTQGAVTSPGANTLGIVMSNACEMKLGAR